MDWGERGCPGPPEAFRREPSNVFFCICCVLYSRCLLLHYAYVSLLRAFAYPTCEGGMSNLFWGGYF